MSSLCADNSFAAALRPTPEKMSADRQSRECFLPAKGSINAVVSVVAAFCLDENVVVGYGMVVSDDVAAISMSPTLPFGACKTRKKNFPNGF
ncbi:MAG: hypothetical protein ACPGWR_06915 [Ardenticatenaceae bacterium]